MDEERLIILRRIESGDITVEDGMKILDAIEGRTYSSNGHEPAAEVAESFQPQGGSVSVVAEEEQPASMNEDDLSDSRWKVWSWAIFAVFVILTVLSGVWMIQGWNVHPWGWGFWLAWIPFIIGVLGMIGTYNARWVHVRVLQPPGERPQRISISLPLPLGLLSIIVPLFSRWIPAEVHGQNLVELIREMDRNISSKDPIHVFVDDKDGTRVEVYIG
jgi:hypothetical protein